MGLVVAVLAAIFFAFSTSLQHRANAKLLMDGDTDSAPEGRRSHFSSLLREPWWLVGQVLALTAFALHAWALNIGLLVVVQPVVVSGIVLAVPVRAALERRLPHPREAGSVALTATGLSLFLLAARPSVAATDHAMGVVGLVAAVLGMAVAVFFARWARARSGLARAGRYGVASGVLFGLTAGLVKLTTVTVASSDASSVLAASLAVLTAWPAWLVPVVGLAGVVLNQRAYRAGPLSASMPVLNIVNVLVAIAFGIVVFGEIPAHHPLDLVGQAAGIALMLIGLRRLAVDDASDFAVEADSRRSDTSGSRI